jgi:DNA-binding beta-propeller fold protein YncE
MSCLPRIAAGFILLFSLTTVPRVAAQTYKALGEYKIPGTSAKSIAVDTEGRRLLIAGSDGVTILNADSGTLLGKVDGLKDAQDVLLVPDMKGDDAAPSTRAFASGADGRVIEFSLASLKVLAEVELAASGPAQLCYDNDERTVEAVSATGLLTTIDDAGKIVSSGKLPTGIGQIVCGNMDHVYVADTATNVVHVLNHTTLKNDGDFPIKSGNRPTGLALDTKGRRLFVTCEDGTIEIIDTDAGFTFIELPGGKGPARETFVWLPQGKGQWKAAAFVAQLDGTLSAIRMNAFINYTLGGQYKLAPGLGAIAYDEKTHHLFMTSTESGAPVVVVAGY